ncbi:MAG: ligase-associated DNA damage response DEXH box helicase [Flavobacteriales bacterium]
MSKSIAETSACCVEWMAKRQWQPLAFQREAWQSIDAGKDGLVNAPTGSGKTYSVLLPLLMRFQSETKSVADIRIIWLTPIRALAREIQLSAERVIESAGLPLTVGIRTGDTSSAERAKQRSKQPNILITTPESLHLMLCSKGCNNLFARLEAVVADEWHDVMGTKRGVQVELALSRLKTLAPSICIWGISATIGNLEEAMNCLLGKDRASAGVLIRSSTRKAIHVESLLPAKAERLPWAGHLGLKMAEHLIPVIERSESTLVFTNVRSQCEIWYRKLLELNPDLAGVMAMHHGSISKEIRHWVEQSLHDGRLKAVVCTGSLDLGVDFAPVETIIQIGGPKGISRFVQRAGRSGHRPDAASTIYFLPTHSLELIEASALRQAIAEDFLESKTPLYLCFDVLVQYLVTLATGDGFDARTVLNEIRNTLCFEAITDQEWHWVLGFTTNGGHALRSYDDYHKLTLINGRYHISSTRLARRHRMSIGTIVSDTLMAVKLSKGGLLGYVEESFITQLNEGDNFWFAGLNLEIIRIKNMVALVRKSKQPKGRSPVWLGGRLPLTSNMSIMLRRKMEEAALMSETSSLPSDTELNFIQPIIQLQQQRSHVPLGDELLIELFETKEGFHALFYPFEGRAVHEGLASLIAYRLGKIYPCSFSLAYNDYGFELLSDQPIRLEEGLQKGILEVDNLERDMLAGINSSELARRRFRDIAAIAGLVFKGYPGQQIKERHLQSSSQLIFDVFTSYEPENLLVRQAYDEVIHQQLEFSRTQEALQRMEKQRRIIRKPERPTPLAFPIMVDRLREQMSSEELVDRVQRMTLEWDS